MTEHALRPIGGVAPKPKTIICGAKLSSMCVSPIPSKSSITWSPPRGNMVGGPRGRLGLGPRSHHCH